jgi:putative membrane protein
MTDQSQSTGPGRFEIRTTSDSHFSWLRTRLSAERTLMSWVRTSVSLIGFGFTIVQFFEHFAGMQGIEPALRPQAPRFVGLALILLGVGALAVSLWQYQTLLRYLWSTQFQRLAGVDVHAHKTPLVAVALVLMLIGVLAFVTIVFRLA